MRFQCMTEVIFRHAQYLTSACVLLVNITVQGEDQNSIQYVMRIWQGSSLAKYINVAILLIS
jgi:hypothetical protein